MERNRILEEVERHLLVQEVTNRLMEVELEQRDMQLRFLTDPRRNGTIRRWKTFSGRDQVVRRVSELMRTVILHSLLKSDPQDRSLCVSITSTLTDDGTFWQSHGWS